MTIAIDSFPPEPDYKWNDIAGTVLAVQDVGGTLSIVRRDGNGMDTLSSSDRVVWHHDDGGNTFYCFSDAAFKTFASSENTTTYDLTTTTAVPYWYPLAFIDVDLMACLSICESNDANFAKMIIGRPTAVLRHFKFRDVWEKNIIMEDRLGVSKTLLGRMSEPISLNRGHCYVGVVVSDQLFDVIYCTTTHKVMSSTIPFP